MTKKKIVIFIALHGDEQKRLCKNMLVKKGFQLFWLNGDKVEGKLDDYESDEVYALPE